MIFLPPKRLFFGQFFVLLGSIFNAKHYIIVYQKVKLSILGISYSQVQAGAYALIFTEESGARRLPIIVGSPEAQSIAIVMEGIEPPRPLSHDLMRAILRELDIELLEVLIYKYEEGAFFSELVLQQNGKKVHIDARTSDAVALAMRTKSPIYTTEEIMRNMAVVFQEQPDSDETSQKEVENDDETLASLRVDALKQRLEEALAEENYELASRLRDEINQREL